MTRGVNYVLREPLFHFLAIGLLLFLLFAVVNDDQRAAANRIEITNADIEQLAQIFRKQWQRPPGPEELQSLIDSRVREEVLYREALAMGLDEGDTIVRRRLAQKVEFLMADTVAEAAPDDASLQAYYDDHAERYREPPRLSFKHIYFSTDRRGKRATNDAEALLERLRGASAPVTQAPAAEGDTFMLPRTYVDKRSDEIARDFGRAFAQELTGLETKQWQGPVASAYGIHLVYISSREEARLPPLDEIRSRLANDWLVEQRRTADERIYQRLRSRYEVSVSGQQNEER